jgi:hypothetical protein
MFPHVGKGARMDLHSICSYAAIVFIAGLTLAIVLEGLREKYSGEDRPSL